MRRRRAPLPYRPCVGIALFNADGLVFVGRRKPDKVPDPSGNTYEWQMPQGGIDPGEAVIPAAFRELFEETNIRSVEVLAEAEGWFTYDLPKSISRPFKGRFRGQTQKWIALRFTGNENEINVLSPGNGAHKPEFIDWRWEQLENLPGMIVPFKRGVYDQVVAAFAHLTQSN